MSSFKEKNVVSIDRALKQNNRPGRESFGARILAIKERFGLSLREIADELGTRESTISKWVHLSERTPRQHFLRALELLERNGPRLTRTPALPEQALPRLPFVPQRYITRPEVFDSPSREASWSDCEVALQIIWSAKHPLRDAFLERMMDLAKRLELLRESKGEPAPQAPPARPKP